MDQPMYVSFMCNPDEDPEIQAMVWISRIMQYQSFQVGEGYTRKNTGLDAGQQARVIQWAAERWGKKEAQA